MKIRRVVSVACSAVLCGILFLDPMKNVYAEENISSEQMTVQGNNRMNSAWTKVGNEWHLADADGNELIARLRDKKLTILGKGAIPSYTDDYAGNRPWDDWTYYSLDIGDGVTSIGSRAFVQNEYLKNISFFSSTFVDKDSFRFIPSGTLITIQGTKVATRTVGNFPYTSVDSIAYFVQENNGYFQVQFANNYMVSLAKSKTSQPGLLSVFTSDTGTVNYADPNFPIINYESKIVSLSPTTNYVNIQYKLQGPLTNEVFAAFLGDRQYVAAYNMTLANSKGLIKKTPEKMRYKMTVPAAYQSPGRHFSLIGIGEGEVLQLEDLDTDDNTVSFETDIPSTAYALVYTD